MIVSGSSAAIPALATAVTITGTFTLPYQIALDADWVTSFQHSGKTASQFTVTFGTPAPAAGGTLDWLAIMPDVVSTGVESVTSDVMIAANALRQIGAAPIRSFEDDSTEGRLAKALYLPTVDELLQTHNWNFAVRRQALQEVTATPAYGYDHQFQLPQNPLCLQVLDTSLTDRDAYEIETVETSNAAYRVLLTDATSVSIRFIARVTDPNLYSALFTTALTDRLSYEFCVLKRNVQQQDMWFKKSEMALQRAKSRDGQEGRSLRKLSSTSLTVVR